MLEVLQILLGWLLADLLSGLVHYISDNAYRQRHWPILGAMFRDSQQHHSDPRHILSCPLWSISWKPMLASLPLLLGVPMLPWFFVPLTVGLMLSTYIHVLAHRERNPWPVRWLQRCHIIMPPAAHARHHGQQFDQYYAVVNGWSNPLLNWLFRPRATNWKWPES